MKLKEIDETETPHIPQNKNSAISKLRRDGKHCPVCVARLETNATRTRLKKKCSECQAQPTEDQCPKCRAHAMWRNRTFTACQSCGKVNELKTI